MNLDPVVLVAVSPTLFFDAFAGQSERLSALRSLWNAGPNGALDGRHFDLRASNRFADRHRQINVNVVAASLEEWMRCDVHAHVEIARLPALPPPPPPPPDADRFFRCGAPGDLHLDVNPVDGQIHRRPGDRP